MNMETVAELKQRLGLRTLCEGSPERAVNDGYCGDLLSWVMGRAPADCAWITVMGNLNVVAVASLADVACVILAEDAVLDEDALSRAQAEGMNIYASSQTSFALCRAI